MEQFIRRMRWRTKAHTNKWDMTFFLKPYQSVTIENREVDHPRTVYFYVALLYYKFL